MSTNTEIIGDPASCRASGEWLRGLAESAMNSSVQLGLVSTNSEYCWNDAVGDLFRAKIDRGRQDGATLYDDIGRIGDAVVGFADDLERARASMTEARTVAVQDNVPLTATTIEEPQMPQSDPTEDDVTAIGEHAEAMDRYRAAMDAYHEALGIVRRARDEERDAHDTLRRKAEEESGQILQTVATSPFMEWGQRLAWVGLGYSTDTYAQASTWSTLATAQQGLAEEARTAWNSGTNQAARNAALSTFLHHQGQSLHMNAAVTRLQNAPLLTRLQASPSGTRALRWLSASPANQLPDTAPPVARGLVGNLSRGNVILAGVGVGTDIAAGESAQQAVASQGAALVAGGAATTLLMASATGGPAAFGAVLVGVGVAWAADAAVDHLFEQ